MASRLIPKWLSTPVNWLLVAAGCAGPGGGSSRYTLATLPGSRYDFRYVMDKQTRRWVQRDVELRVSVDRKIPEPLLDPKSGNLLSVQLVKPGSAQTGGIDKMDFEIRDGYRVWKIRDVMHEQDIKGDIRYVITIKWPHDGQSTEYDPTEVFPMPAPGNVPPDEWSPWMSAGSLREGGFGWWEEARNVPAAPVTEGSTTPAHPFQMRYRLLLVDNPVVIPPL
ncbi:MAG: hypothetical protein ABI852_13245 [Gemmatimonadaceae bacterium]